MAIKRLPHLYLSLFACMQIAASCAFAQVRMESLTVADGLSQGFVTSMIQDSRGFMWFGTYDGLNRYDGYSVQRFTTKPFNPWSLQSSFVTQLYEGRQGLIWVGTHQGLCVFDPLTERFFGLNLLEHRLPSNHVGKIIGDHQGNIFVHIPSDMSVSGVFRIQVPLDFANQLRLSPNPLKGIQAEPVGGPNTLRPPCNLIACVGDTMPLLSDASLLTYRYSYADGNFQEFDLRRLPASSTDAHNILWDNSCGFFYRWRLPDGRDSVPPYDCWPKIIPMKDGSAAIWLVNSGLMYRKNTHEPIDFDIFLPRDALLTSPAFLRSFSLLLENKTTWNNQVLIDQSGIIWAATGGWGIRKINPGQLSFGNLLAGHSISSLRELPDGRIWVRFYSDNSLILDPVTGATETPTWGGRKWIYEVYADRNENLWIVEPQNAAQANDRLWKYDKRSGQYFTFPNEIPFINGVPEKIIEDPHGNIWIAAHQGNLLRCQPGKLALESFSYASAISETPESLRATAIALGKNGALWIGTNRGLLRVDGLDGPTPRFTVFKHKASQPQTISIDWVTSICADPQNPHLLWLGTRGGGINRLDIQTEQFSFIADTPNGLPDNVVYGILPDGHGNLWCSTNRGLCRFNPQQGSFVTYQESDGLLSTEFNTNAYLRSRDGRLWFGGVSGLNVFRGEDILAHRIPPKVAISGIRVRGTPRLPDAAGQLSLSYQENNVIFEFAVLDFTNPATNRFRHRLKGIDRTWVEDGTDHSANYAALPPGNYVLELQGATADSPWSEPGVLFKLCIHPPWYRHWLAWLGYGLLAWALISGIIRYRDKYYRLEHAAETNLKESARLKSFEAIKNQFFANIAHELRTPLTVILGLANRLKEGNDQGKVEENARSIAEQGNVLLDLTNQILDLAKLESQQFILHPTNGNISQFVQQHAASLVPLAESKGLRLLMENEVPEVWMDFDAAQIQKILNNLISNAIRHSEPGKSILIRTTLENDNTWWRLDVKDQGEGISDQDLPYIFDRFYQGSNPSGKSGASGLGLTLTRDLVKLMEGEILVESNADQGAMFSIRLPIRNQMPRWKAPEGALFDQKVVRMKAPLANTRHLPLLLALEDNEAVGSFLQQCLQDHYRVEIVTDGALGLEKAFAMVPDIILTDLAMPGKDGFEVTTLLKNDVRTSHIPIVMLTARIEPQHRLEGKRRGANAYLTKPFEEQELLLILNNLLHLQSQWKQRYMQFSWAQASPLETNADLQIEDAFMQNLFVTFEDNYTDESFNLERLCRLLGMSSSQLDRKLKVLRNQSPMQMLRSFRLQKARILLQSKPKPSIKDVCFKVGFKSPAHFSRAFSEEFGTPPSEV